MRDTREKKPLIFPETLSLLDDTKPSYYRIPIRVRLRVEDFALKTGDYALLEHEECCLVERKGSLREIANNCLTKDGRRRFVSQVDRLKEECKNPILMLEGTPMDLQRATKHVPEPGLALDAFQRILFERQVTLVLLPSATVSARRAVGEWVARLLINGALNGSP